MADDLSELYRSSMERCRHWLAVKIRPPEEEFARAAGRTRRRSGVKNGPDASFSLLGMEVDLIRPMVRLVRHVRSHE